MRWLWKHYATGLNSRVRTTPAASSYVSGWRAASRRMVRRSAALACGSDFLRTGRNGKLDTCGCSKSSSLFTPSRLVRTLLDIRFFVGRFFSWDHEPAPTAWKSFTTRLTDTDHARSLAAAGTRDGFFRVVYRFENEQLVELINRTVHAAALSALVETPTTYRFYLGVYVRSISRFTPFYMALIDPFRKLDRLSVPLA